MLSEDNAGVADIEQQFENEDEAQRKARTSRLLRKIDLHLLPLLTVMSLLNFLDRPSFDRAGQGSLEADLGIKSTALNLMTSLGYLLYLLVQLPSNMRMTGHKLQPRVYLCTPMLL